MSAMVDGFIPTLSLDEVLTVAEGPLINLYKKSVSDFEGRRNTLPKGEFSSLPQGGVKSSYLEEKSSTSKLYSWKTRGQLHLSKGKISAMAGLQEPAAETVDISKLVDWFQSKVMCSSCKTLNVTKILTSLISVYKESPFGGNLELYKYISTQYEFKRRIDKIKSTENSLNGVDYLLSKPRENVFDMETSINQ